MFREVNMNKLNTHFARNSHTSQFTLQSPCSVKNCCHCWMIIVRWKARRNFYLSIKNTRGRIFILPTTARLKAPTDSKNDERQRNWDNLNAEDFHFSSRVLSSNGLLKYIKVNKNLYIQRKTNERRWIKRNRWKKQFISLASSSSILCENVKMCFVSVEVMLWKVSPSFYTPPHFKDTTKARIIIKNNKFR